MKKSATVCFSVDDVYPGCLRIGVLDFVARLLERHPLLKITLFTTPDWREMSPVPTRQLLATIPRLRDYCFLAKIYPKGAMRLERHPEFVTNLKALARTEIALHGLHHVHRGLQIPVEFQEQNKAECKQMLHEGLSIFEAAGLPKPMGMAPPGWNAPTALIEAMEELGFSYLASARDIRTPVKQDALGEMSGLQNLPLYQPLNIGSGRLVHVPTNFQATSDRERAFQILDMGGLLSIKAHAIKNAFGHVALDGLDKLYFNYLDTLFSMIEDRYGNSVDWKTMGEISAAV